MLLDGKSVYETYPVLVSMLTKKVRSMILVYRVTQFNVEKFNTLANNI